MNPVEQELWARVYAADYALQRSAVEELLPDAYRARASRAIAAGNAAVEALRARVSAEVPPPSDAFNYDIGNPALLTAANAPPNPRCPGCGGPAYLIAQAADNTPGGYVTQWRCLRPTNTGCS